MTPRLSWCNGSLHAGGERQERLLVWLVSRTFTFVRNEARLGERFFLYFFSKLCWG